MPEGLPGKKGCLVAVAQDLDSGENGAMDKTTLFTMALGLQAPWEVKDLQFNKEGQRLDIIIDFSQFAAVRSPLEDLPR